MTILHLSLRLLIQSRRLHVFAARYNSNKNLVKSVHHQLKRATCSLLPPIHQASRLVLNKSIMPKKFQPTSEQLALAEERKRKKEERRLAQAQEEEEKSRTLHREWVDVSVTGPADKNVVRVMSWNLLAQCLVRRELFPESDCLKAHQREFMIYSEILSHDADICCLQEVDRTEKLIPILENAGYTCIYAAAFRKKHGLLIAFRKGKFEVVRQRVVAYDEQEVRAAGSERARIGSSFRTRNIGSLVALRRTDHEDEGFIVATTHLFWHPAYQYERARQAGILLREVIKLRDEDLATRNWPCIIAGDFNFQPNDAAYALMVGDPLLPEHAARLEASRVVHTSIDPAVPKASDAPAEEDEAQEGGDDSDKVIKSARPAKAEDGLLTPSELVDSFGKLKPLRSAYDTGQRLVPQLSGTGLTFGSRVPTPDNRWGGYEPIYTSYTHYWKTVLDYIFVLDPADLQHKVHKLAKPHPAEPLHPGLPMKGVCGSDHISLAAELSWTEKQRGT